MTTALRGDTGLEDDGADETAAPSLDVGMFSEDEMSEDRWTVDHLLVIFEDNEFIDDMVSAEASTRLTLPIHDNDQGRPQIGLEVSTMALTRQYSHSAIPYLETTVGTFGIVGHRTLFPTVSMYLPTSIAWDATPG